MFQMFKSMKKQKYIAKLRIDQINKKLAEVKLSREYLFLFFFRD